MHRPPPPAASLAPMQAATRSIIEAGKASKATDSLAAVADSLKKVGMGRRGTGSPAAARFRKGALATEAAAAQLGLVYEPERTTRNLPRGCSRYGRYLAVFNWHPVGVSHDYSTPICVQAQ